MRLRRRTQAKVEFPLSSMIDCTFLLLIFFMVASTFHRQEADISFGLPGTVEQDAPAVLPDEQILEIRPDGGVVLNDLALDTPTSQALPELQKTLLRFREACAAAKVEAMLTIDAGDGVPHQRVIDVLNACAQAEVVNISFALEADDAL